MTCLFLPEKKNFLDVLKLDEDHWNTQLDQANLDVESFKFKLEQRQEAMLKEFTVIEDVLRPQPHKRAATLK